MTQITLTYFNHSDGRGEVARLAMALADLPFDDQRIAMADWPGLKPTQPFRAMPVLEVDGEVISQSNAINRLVGRLSQLYPTDPWQAALCDEVMDAVEDILSKIVATFSIAGDEEKKKARESLVNGLLPVYLIRLQTYLEARGGEYFADNRLTVADLKVFVFLRSLRTGNIEHIPADLIDNQARLLVQHLDRLSQHPKLMAYYR